MDEALRNLNVLYSPRQIYVASFIGGPLAGSWFVSRNSVASEDRSRVQKTLLFGAAATLALCPIAAVLPKSFHGPLIPLAYSWGYYAYAKMKLDQMYPNGAPIGSGSRHWWKLIGVSIGWCAATLVILFGGVMVVTRFFPKILP